MGGPRLNRVSALLQGRDLHGMPSRRGRLAGFCSLLGKVAGPSRLLVLACMGPMLLGSCQALSSQSEPAPQTAGVGKVNSIPPATLGLKAPANTQELGQSFLVVGHSDRLLDQEAGERIRGFWPLRELLQSFSKRFQLAETPLTLAVQTCPNISPQGDLQLAYHQKEQRLILCYALLQQMDDYADDLSGSLTEQHLAVLDMVYFTVARELSRLVLAANQSTDDSRILAIKPMDAAAQTELNELPKSAVLDALTAQLPAHLKLQHQTAVLSGTQWLFNQGNPLLSPQKLKSWTGDPMARANYQTLICTAQAIRPEQFPFLANELPAELELEDCR